MKECPPPQPDPVIEFYKQRVDMDAIRENLKLTPEQRIQRLMDRLRAEEDHGRATRESRGREREREADDRCGSGSGEHG